jgi:hypothetical protein
MIPIEMNYLAVLAGALVSVAIGFIWYMPLVCGHAWMRAIGKTEEQVRRDFSYWNIAWAFVLGFLMSYGIARIIAMTGRNSMGGGIWIGLLAAICFVGASTVVHHVFEGRRASLSVIYVLHHLVEFVAIGAILGVWMS